MQVVYSLGARLAGGGIGTTAYHAVRGLHRHGVLQRVLCGSARATAIPVARIRSQGLANRALRKLAVYDRTRWLSYLEAVLYDAWAARHLEPADVFHVWGNYGLRSLARARAMGMVTICERASYHPAAQARLLADEYRRWGIEFRLPRRALRRAAAEMGVAHRVLIPSDVVRQTFIEEGYPHECLLQVPFGCDVDHFRPGQPGPHPFRVLYAGQVGIGKGVPYLLEAWRQLGWQDAELWLAGRAEAAFPPLMARWSGLPGLQQLGHLRDMAGTYQQADVFAFPSLSEGSALVTYEAMACGLPLVTTPNAGSVARDGVDGFIVPARDVEALAGRLEHLRADAALRRQMGAAARQRAEAYTWENYGDRLVQAYRQALALLDT